MSRYLVTGAQGFFGAYIIKRLLQNNYVNSASDIIACDIRENNGIFDQILSPSDIKSLKREYFDITNIKTLQSILNRYKPNYVIHLAGLQIPTCRARPILGGTVNVIGTLTVFECVKQYNDNKNDIDKIKSIIYASSAGICGKKEDYLPNTYTDDTDIHIPRTHYGVFKLCNEGNARIYFQDHGIPSVGLRPLTVYGVGREVGLTSDATKAIKSAVLKRKFEMGYRGTTFFQYVEDIADVFIRCSKQCEIKPGAYSGAISGITMDCKDFLRNLFKLIPDAAKYITLKKDGIVLPFPDKLTQNTLDNLFKGQEPLRITPISDAIEKVVKQFQQLKRQNRLHSRDLPSKL
eukprot:107976_1